MRSSAPDLVSTLLGLARDPLAFLTSAQERWGDVVRLPLGHRSFVLVTHPEGVRHVLVENARNYDKDTRTFAKIRGVVGGGLLTSDGEAWLRRRRAAQPAFLQSRVAAVAPIIASAADAMVGRWRARSTVDLGAEMARLALEIAVAALLGRDLGADADVVAQAAAEVIQHTNRRIEAWIDVPAALPTPSNLRFRRARERLDAVVARMLASPTAGEAELFARLRNACADDEGTSALRDEVVTMLLAGHETTANLLTWALYEVARSSEAAHPLDQDRATRVLEETLRLHPPAWILERRAIEEDRIGGHPISPGTIVALSPYVTHRCEDLWPRPDVFDPERFAPEEVCKRPRFAFFPFGAGARQCIGGHFAMMEARMILTSVLDAFDLSLADDAPLRALGGVTLRPRGPVVVRLSPRKKAVRRASA